MNSEVEDEAIDEKFWRIDRIKKLDSSKNVPTNNQGVVPN